MESPVHALQMPPQRSPPARQPRRALDLADDGEDVLVQKRPALLGQKLPALQQPVLQGDQPLHLRRRDAILPRHPAELRPVVPGPAQKLLARVLAPVEEPTARDKGPDAEQAGEDVRCFEGREGSETCEGSERRQAYHQPPREVLSTVHAVPPRSLRPEARCLLGRRGLDRFGLAQAHLDLHHLELPLGVEPLYVDLGRRYLALGLAGAELAYGLRLVGGLADGLPRLLQVAG